MSVKMRQEVERKIATALVEDLIAAGYLLSINNGADEEIKPTADAEAVLAAMFQTDEEHVLVYRQGKRYGWAFFVYGNDGWDVISDYSVNLEPHLARANSISDHYAD